MDKEKNKVNVLSSYLEMVGLDKPTNAGILVALLVLAVTLIIFAVWKRSRVSRKGVLLMGLSDSGKTLIYSRLLHDKFLMTHTSMKENIGEYSVNGSILNIIDIPGHERVRYKFFDEYKLTARGIVFIVDSVTIMKDVKDAAEFLYSILTDPVISKNKVPILILCNKQDNTMARGQRVVQPSLEKELNLLRVTQSSQLESTNETSSNSIRLGIEGQEFEFSHLEPQRIEFAESAAMNGDSDKPAELGSLTTWISTIV